MQHAFSAFVHRLRLILFTVKGETVLSALAEPLHEAVERKL